MKKASLVGLCVVLTTAVAWARLKPYSTKSVTVVGTTVNSKNVRTITTWGVGSIDGLTLTFSCNDNKAHCFAPEIGKTFLLVTPPATSACDNYLLGGQSEDDLWLDVCLKDVRVKER